MAYSGARAGSEKLGSPQILGGQYGHREPVFMDFLLGGNPSNFKVKLVNIDVLVLLTFMNIGSVSD